MQTATGSHIPNVSGGVFAEHFLFAGSVFLLSLFRISFLDQIQDAVKSHCNDTQYKNRHQNRSKLKGLAGINNQIAKPLSGSDKFTDDDTYKTKADINLHDTQDQRHGGGKDNFCQLILFGSSKGGDQLSFIRVSILKACIKIDHRP